MRAGPTRKKSRRFASTAGAAMTKIREDPREREVPDGLPADAGLTFDPTRTEIYESAGGDGQNDAAGDENRPAAPSPNGSFKLHRFIDRGGYGEVWEATQTSLHRTVALKRLREDALPAGSCRARRVDDFRREALTTAALEHPNIVPVYDAGEDRRGQPQLAMKLVRGATWKEKIKEDADLPPEEFLGEHLPILIDVAQAVAFAHSRGVMHRDVKPSQVLLGEFGEVLLVDWGLAVRFADGPDADNESNRQDVAPTGRSLETATCPAGTPAFMAPEQTDDVPDRLGPWTDVYLLGGMLYLLLTGSPPRCGVSAAGAFLLASMGEIETPRRRAPSREIPDDLEALAMRSMTVDRFDRPTAREFILGLQEHLSGAGKHRASLELTGQVGRNLATAEESYGVLSQCLSDLDRASGLWDGNPEIDDLRERVLSRYATTALGNGDLELARRQAARLSNDDQRRSLSVKINDRMARHRRTARQRRFFFRVSLALASALLAFGIKHTIDQARARDRLAEQRNAAVTARQQAEGFATFMLEELTPSLEALGRLDILDRVAEESISYYASLPADEGDAGVLMRRSLALRNAGRVLRHQGQLDDARIALEKSLAVVRELVDLDPSDPSRRAHLGDRLLELGVLTEQTSDPDAATAAYGQAVEVYEGLMEDEPDSVEVRRGLARGLYGLAYELWARAELDAALEILDRAVALLEPLMEEGPDDLRSARLLVEVYARAGGIHRDRGEFEEAAAVTRRAIEIGRFLVEADPTSILNLAALSESASSLGFTLWRMNDLPGALAAYREVLDIDRQLADRDPTNQSRQRDLAIAHSNVGEMLRDLGNVGAALESQQAAVAILDPVVAANPDQAEWRYALASAYVELGTSCSSVGSRSRAVDAWNRAVSLLGEIAIERGDLYYLDTYARALLLLGRVEEARPVVEELRSKGWNSEALRELSRRHGLDGAATELTESEDS